MKPTEGTLPLDLDALKWDAAGLIPAVVQDRDGVVLMVAYCNREALAETLATGYATYYSRSRQQLWRKGESSGHRQQIIEIRIDCDLDCLLFIVSQQGGACHTGYYSCFYRRVAEETIKVVEQPVFDPKQAYK